MRRGRAIGSSAETLDAARRYLDRGWALLPLAPEAKEPHHRVLREVHGKSAWSPLAARPASFPEVQAWLEADPRCGIGILTGAASGGLVVADVDRSLDIRHPPTPAVRTARGWHLYFATDALPRARGTSWGDLKADGGYVVAPPSVHPSGTRYEWSIGLDEPLARLEESGLWTPQGNSPSVAGGLPRDRYLYLGGPGEAHSAVGDSFLDLASERPQFDGEPSASDDAAVLAAQRVLGINAPRGSAFCCVLPGHTDGKPSASLYRDRKGIYRYRDWHRESPFEWLTLAEVRAAQVSGVVERLTGPVAARWYDRLFAEAGLILLPEVGVPRFHAPVRRSAERVREGFELLMRIRERKEPGEPIPFTRSFAAGWCGVSEDQAREAIRMMKDQGVMVRVGEHMVGGRSMYLYRPGPFEKRRLGVSSPPPE